jgi:hypothetical protein
MVWLQLILKEKVKEILPIPIAHIPRLKPGQSQINTIQLSLILDDRTKIVHWVTESLRPFSIVNDSRFQSFIKTGHPNQYIPSPWTVA